MNISEATDSAAIDALEDFLQRFDRLMASNQPAALRLVDAAPEPIRAESEWVLCRAEALESVLGPASAVEFLAGVVAAEPEFADAHHYLAELYQELGRGREATKHQLRTLSLDCALDRVAESASVELQSALAAEAARVLSALPPRLRERVAHVPVFLQPRPSEELVAEGFDSRLLGLFQGPNLADVGMRDMTLEPTAITLFVQCLIDAFGDDEAELLEQVRVTVLHEVGHYFCLDEEQLAELGLA